MLMLTTGAEGRVSTPLTFVGLVHNLFKCPELNLTGIFWISCCMQLDKPLACPQIILALFASLLLAPALQPAFAQLPQFSCVANAAGDGWICESTTTPESTGGTVPQPAQISDQVEQDAPGAQNQDPAPAQAAQPIQPIQSIQPTATPTPVRVNRTELDWVSIEQMTQEQRENLLNNCCGAFIEPDRPSVNLDENPADGNISFDTVGGFSQPTSDLITIDGEVIVRQGSRTVENNNSTSINQANDTVLLDGDVIFREPGVLLRGNSAFVDNATNQSRIENAQYVLHNYGAHGQAASVVYSTDSGLVTIENGEFSRCEPDSNFWRLEANNIILNQQEGRGYARAVSLKLKDVPIFYYPFTLPFPLGDERMSGLLAPSAGSTRSGGFDFTLPYYLNLAPNYDATLTPRLISDRGVLASAEIRYLANWSMNTLNMSNLDNDKLYDASTANLLGSDSPPREHRWFIGYEHFGSLGRNWSTFVDYNEVSDDDYFYDLGSTGLNVASRTNLNQQARLNYQGRNLRAGLNVQRTEIIDPFIPDSSLSKPFDRLPQFFFDTDVDLVGGFRLSLAGEVTSFDRDLDESLLSATSLSNGALVDGERANLEPALEWSLEAPGWFVRTSAKYKYIGYKLQNQAAGTVDDPDTGVGVYSFDSGLVFERQMRLGGGAFTQTLEPRLYYLYSEFEDQSLLPVFDSSELSFSFNQLFRDDRFSGGDRVGDADQVTFALTSRILDEVGRERARFSLGQINYFEDRLVGLSNPLQTWQTRSSPLASRSSLAGEIGYAFGDRWRVNTDVQWNEDTEEIEEGSFQFRYRADNDHLFNISYRFRSILTTNPAFVVPASIDPRIKQTDVSGIWPLAGNWKLLARWNYDHSNSRNLESFAGVEYSNCCATIRIIGREWVDEDELFLPNIKPNRGIFVQFTLNGLGNITGGGLSNLLSDGIPGASDDDY
jgi:LPS-assembly protein